MASFFPSSDKETPNSKYPGPVLGSDFPVEPPNPFHGMYAAVTRLSPLTGTSPSGKQGWYSGESLTVDQALLGFTRNGAYGWFQEENMASIELGKWADFVIVDRNIWEDKSGKSLRDVVVRETWVGGRKVYPLDEPDLLKVWVGRITGTLSTFIEQISHFVRGKATAEL
jgi:hypothetical protein